MDELRKLIVARVKEKGHQGRWLTDVYWHLIDQGATSEEVIRAMTLFVDDLIALKMKKKNREPAE